MSALLELTNLSVTLRGARVVDSVSLTIAPGEVVALLGPNGAGKTSLIRASLGLIASSGEAKLLQRNPRELSARERALRAAYLPQRPQSIWPVSVERLVALGRYAYGAAPDTLSMTDRAAVDSAIDACDLTALRARRMDEISGGEKARAHLARALAQAAPLLLLDEPTAGLDPAQALGVADIVRAHAGRGGGALFSTHDVALAARAADRIVLLREGCVIAQGAPRAALTEETLQAAYGRRARVRDLDGAFVATFE
ncbi:MAG: ABC transporter ATP-binding protein [Hyphomonadaceae bacterium]|nr:ABC transporter ATP-binding protein [Hyphomonadaceae bacterium]